MMIAIDWGSSSLRAYLLDSAGQILEQRRSAQGILACEGRYAQTLAQLIEGWPGDIVLCGMITSRNGWIELPYLGCPVTANELASAMHHYRDANLPGRELWFVPGVTTNNGGDVPDVMRGEETQIIGLLATLKSGKHSVCLPGTHSKWATLSDGRLNGFATVMTGELYALLRHHSILGRLMSGDEQTLHDAAFTRGVQRANAEGGLLHHIFGTRTLGLFGRLPAETQASYLSGLLISHEIRDRLPLSKTVHLIGSDGLARRYARALQILGIDSIQHPEGLAATGLHKLSQLRGLQP
jgi:2-dehydro-3-deoxygalactonokinase